MARLAGPVVSDWMTEDPVTVASETPLAVCAAVLRANRFRHLPVLDGTGRAVGLLADFDVTSRGEVVHGVGFAAYRPEDEALPALRACTSPLVTLVASAPIPPSIDALLDARAEVAVVVDADARVVGVLAEHDVTRRAPDVLAPNHPVPPTRRPVVTVSCGEPAATAWALMREHGVRHVIVLDGATPYGVISARDLAADDVPGGRHLTARDVVRDLCPIVAMDDTSLVDAARTMASCRIGCLPVLGTNGLVSGVVTRTDVLRAVRDAVAAGSGRQA